MSIQRKEKSPTFGDFSGSWKHCVFKGLFALCPPRYSSSKWVRVPPKMPGVVSPTFLPLLS